LRHLYLASYTLFEYVFFSTLLISLAGIKKNRNIILILSVCFILFQIGYFFVAKFKRLDSVPIGIETILLLFFSVLLFAEQFKITKTDTIYSNPWFFIAIGIVIYLSGSFFFNILANNIDIETTGKYWFFTYIFETIKNMLFAISIFIIAKKGDENSTKKSSAIPNLDMI